MLFILPNWNLQRAVFFCLVVACLLPSNLGSAGASSSLAQPLVVTINQQAVARGSSLLLGDLVSVRLGPKLDLPDEVLRALDEVWSAASFRPGANYVLGSEIATRLKSLLPDRYTLTVVGDGCSVHYLPEEAERKKPVVVAPSVEAHSDKKILFRAEAPTSPKSLKPASPSIRLFSASEHLRGTRGKHPQNPTTYHLPRSYEDGSVVGRNTPIWVRYEKGSTTIQARGLLLHSLRPSGNRVSKIKIKMVYGGNIIVAHVKMGKNLFFYNF